MAALPTLSPDRRLHRMANIRRVGIDRDLRLVQPHGVDIAAERSHGNTRRFRTSHIIN